jgi:hypothetical protein
MTFPLNTGNSRKNPQLLAAERIGEVGNGHFELESLKRFRKDLSPALAAKCLRRYVSFRKAHDMNMTFVNVQGEIVTQNSDNPVTPSADDEIWECVPDSESLMEVEQDDGLPFPPFPGRQTSNGKADTIDVRLALQESIAAWIESAPRVAQIGLQQPKSVSFDAFEAPLFRTEHAAAVMNNVTVALAGDACVGWPYNNAEGLNRGLQGSAVLVELLKSCRKKEDFAALYNDYVERLFDARKSGVSYWDPYESNSGEAWSLNTAGKVRELALDSVFDRTRVTCEAIGGGPVSSIKS